MTSKIYRKVLSAIVVSVLFSIGAVKASAEGIVANDLLNGGLESTPKADRSRGFWNQRYVCAIE
jgi:hypothetical protein